jgi:hypothetical protein
MRYVVMESKYGVPPGEYLARFQKIEPLGPRKDGKPRLAKDGKEMKPGIVWPFEIVWPVELAGKVVDRITSEDFSTRSNGYKMACALLGRTLASREAFDLTPCVGNVYRIVVALKDDGENTFVSDVGLRSATAEELARLRAVSDAPNRSAAATEAVKKWWVKTAAGSPVEKTFDEIVALCRGGADPTELQVGDAAGDWVKALEAVQGLKAQFPF